MDHSGPSAGGKARRRRRCRGELYGHDQQFRGRSGGDNSDLIYGSDTSNSLSGAGGLFDAIFGFGGNDKLNGEGGFQLLVGGRGKDNLTGGAESDIFAYSSIKDSGTTKATRDVITDFEDGANRIDLCRIDANTKLADDQPLALSAPISNLVAMRRVTRALDCERLPHRGRRQRRQEGGLHH